MLLLLIDHPVPYLSPAGGSGSLLTVPLGTRSCLSHLTARLTDVADNELLVMPTFGYGPEYERAIRDAATCNVKVLSTTELSALPNEYEPSDCLLMMDPAWWVNDGLDLVSLAHSCREYRGVTHAVAIGADAESTREFVEHDGDGRVKRVRRLYNGVSWPELANSRILFSLGPIWVVSDVDFVSLAELRAALTSRGILSRDLPVASDPVDLNEEAGLLNLNEQMLADVSARAHPGFRRHHNGVLMGRQCSIHASARLVGPIVIHDRVTIEEDATIVGPAVLGTGSHVGRGATVAQSVVTPRTVVKSGTTMLHRVASEQSPTMSAGGNGDTPRTAGTFNPQAQRPHTDGGVESPPHADRGKQAVHLIAKRVMDVVLSSVLLLTLLPLLVIVAALVKLDSRGPVLFSHRREQKGGKEFSCLKFRTMVADAHQQQRELYKQNEVDGPQFKITHDPRQTRLGILLRETNIDELPQLLNVLWGHMSLVGPRPSPFRENQICVPWRRARLSVAPGITGLWQVCRDDRSGGDFHQWIYYDMAYVRNLSIWLDLRILFATVYTMAGKWSVPLSWFIRRDVIDDDRSVEAFPAETAAFS